METQTFERFEFKYLVPDVQVPGIREFLAPYLIQDAFSSHTGSYLNTNLYFDSPDRVLYWAHAKSHIDRFKLRVRYYDEGPTCFFEIKRKIRDVIVKHRSSIPRADWEAVWDGDERAILASSNPIYLREFLDLALLYRAEPAYLIRYHREAYENIFEDEDARVTFDRAIQYQTVDSLDLRGDDDAWTFMSVPTLVELKFDRFYPTWLRELTLKFDMRRIQFSKYVTTVEAAQEAQYVGRDAVSRVVRVARV